MFTTSCKLELIVFTSVPNVQNPVACDGHLVFVKELCNEYDLFGGGGKPWLWGPKHVGSKPVECVRVWPLASFNVLQGCCNSHQTVHQWARGCSSSCKYPEQGLTLIYSLPQLVSVHGVQIFMTIRRHRCVGPSAGAISTERKKTYCKEHFYFSSFFTVFVSYWVLKLQVLTSSALIFLFVCLCASFFFFT